MSDEAEVTMLLCWGLEAEEQAKVERLDGEIAAFFTRKGLVVRRCLCCVAGCERYFEFLGETGVVGTIAAKTFMEAKDDDIVGRITLSRR